MKRGNNYRESSAAVPSMGSCRCFLACSTANGHERKQYDVKTAFLHVDIPHGINVAVIPPPHLQKYRYHDGAERTTKQHEGQIGVPLLWFLRKALYGLPQSMLLYNEWFANILKTQCDMTNLVSEPCLWVKHYEDNKGEKQAVYLLHWVDDVIISAPPGCPVAAKIIDTIQANMELTGGGPPKVFCGLQIHSCSNGDLKVTQTQSIDTLCENLLGDGNHRPEEMPLSHTVSTPSPRCPPKGPATPLPQTKEKLSKDMGPRPEEPPQQRFKAIYQENIGIALWIAGQTRPGIAAAVSILSRFTANPGVKHMKALKHLARYLHGTRNLGLHYRRHPKSPPQQLSAWSDADWAGCVGTAKSTNGFMAELNDGLIAWFARRQPVVAMPSFESELIALCASALSIAHLRRILPHLGHSQTQPTTIRADNTGALAQSHTDTISRRARHITLRTFKVRELVLNGAISTTWASGNDNISDLCTKNVTPAVMAFLRPKILSEVSAAELA